MTQHEPTGRSGPSVCVPCAVSAILMGIVVVYSLKKALEE